MANDNSVNNPVPNFFRASAADFKKIPGSPIAYWVSQRVCEIFSDTPALDDLYEPVVGLQTSDNERFIRRWSEVSLNQAFLLQGSKSDAAQSMARWFVYQKGGEFRKWYGNYEFLVNWKDDGFAIKNFFSPEGKLLSRPQNEATYFCEGLTWTAISSSFFAVRYCPPGSIGSNAGMMVFGRDSDQLKSLLGLMNSALTSFFVTCLSQTLNFDQGVISRIPLQRLKINQVIDRIVATTADDWNAYERSWDFASLPLLSGQWLVDSVQQGKHQEGQENLPTTHSSLSTCYTLWVKHNRDTIAEMKRLEEENNRLFIDAYSLQDELTPDVPWEEITLTCNPYYRYKKKAAISSVDGGECAVGSEDNYPLSTNHFPLDEELEARFLKDTMDEFISYAVGCMLGRYSLDKPGLVLANQGDTLADYIRKVCSGEWEVGSLSTTHYLLSTNPKGENNGDGSQLQRVDRVAEGDGLSGVGLSSDKAISEGGTLRLDEPGQAVGSFHPVQHSRRAGQKVDGGVSEFLVHCERFKSRDGDPNPACPALEVCNERYSAAHSQPIGGSDPIAERADEQSKEVSSGKREVGRLSTPHCPLSTIHFLPDADNVIPILDGDWFTDDIVDRFCQFLHVTFGEEHYQENLSFIEKAIGKSIRKYFLKGFYASHVKRYKKHPIYWLFSSPKGSFNALIYMHRYTPDTVSIVLNDYLREFRAKLTGRKEHLEQISISGSASSRDKTAALKEIEKLKTTIAELETYETETLYPLATQRIEIDLDDGVKVNYNKFGTALKKIKGLSKE